MYQQDLMSGQRILVTGGGTGLGQAMAEHFLSLGADVAICGRRKQVCDATADAWRKQFPKRRIDTLFSCAAQNAVTANAMNNVDEKSFIFRLGVWELQRIFQARRLHLV